MKYSSKKEQLPDKSASDCLIIPVYSGGELSAAAQAIDNVSANALSKIIQTGDFSGKKGEVQTHYHIPGIAATRVMLAGCGARAGYDIAVFTEVMEKVAAALKACKVVHAASWLAEGLSDQHQALKHCVLTLSAGLYVLDAWKSAEDAKAARPVLEEFTFIGSDADDVLQQAISVTEGVSLARDLANQPGNICTPAYLADVAADLAKEYASVMNCQVLEESDMQELGMGAFLSVSKGSDQDGKLIVLQYKGGPDGAKPAALVGKGITFDTGGISLKPGASMDEMKFDMGGAASVLGTLKAAAAMALPINLIGVVAAAENMPSGRASKPGDIVTSMSGKTIEVLNTDAEGRLVLCDALTYVKKYDPEVVIDIATLTGACIIALGHFISGLISNSDELANEIMRAGKDISDEAWRLPHNDKYSKLLKSEFADLGNIGGREAGTITAGCFLAEFTKDYTWAHLDIAGTAWQGKAASGRPVPLLSQFLIYRCQ